jgi:HEAT repeat protein
LKEAINLIYNSLNHQDLPVRVEAALAINELLYHEAAIEFMKPGLEHLLKTFIKLMDDIDFDSLVKAL